MIPLFFDLRSRQTSLWQSAGESGTRSRQCLSPRRADRGYRGERSDDRGQVRAASPLMTEVRGQRSHHRGQRPAAAAFARSFLAHSLRKTFISALSVVMRGATPLYFFVVPLTVRLTAP